MKRRSEPGIRNQDQSGLRRSGYNQGHNTRGLNVVECWGSPESVGLIIIRPSENHVERVQLICRETIVSSNCQTLSLGLLTGRDWTDISTDTIQSPPDTPRKGCHPQKRVFLSIVTNYKLYGRNILVYTRWMEIEVNSCFPFVCQILPFLPITSCPLRCLDGVWG